MISFRNFVNYVEEGQRFQNVIADEDLHKNIINIISCFLSELNVFLYSKDDVQLLQIDDVGIFSGNLFDRIKKSKSKIHLKTSGTTGTPKEIVHSLSDLLAGTVAKNGRDNSVFGFAYSIRHISGLLLVLQALRWESDLVDLRNLGQDELYKLAYSSQVTHISAPATFFRLSMPLKEPLTSVKRITNGGEPLEDSLIERIKQSFPEAKINNIYASTEFGTLLISNNSTFKIPEGLCNKIEIREGYMYVHESLVSKSVVCESGWYNTKDRVEILDDGKIKIIGREVEQIKVLGHLVSLRKIELAMEELKEIRMSKVTAQRHAVFGNVLRSEIIINEDIDVDSIKLQLSKKLRKYELPMSIKVVDEIALTNSGKLKRS